MFWDVRPYSENVRPCSGMLDHVLKMLGYVLGC